MSDSFAIAAPGLLPRCVQSKQGQVMAIGRAREGGIEVEGKSKLLGYTAFEDVAGGRQPVRAAVREV